MKKDAPLKKEAPDCAVTFNVETTGNINIYNCSNAAKDKDCGCNDDTDTGTTATGACVPASLGAKPKQSQKTKLDRLLKNNPVASAFAASFIHTCKRYSAGKTAANSLEVTMFKKFDNLSPQNKKLLKCTAKSADTLSGKHKSLFAGSLMQDIDMPVTENTLAAAFEKEITSLVSGLALGNNAAPLEERPGKIRLVENMGSDDVYPNQIRIFKVNNLRTTDNVPALRKEDFLPEEFQQNCTPVQNGDHVDWDCKMQQPPCDGNEIDGTCLRVQQIQNGTSVTIEGVNFFDVNATVQLRQKFPGDNTAEVAAFVYGDIDTPAAELINGQQNVIADSRVHDKIFFTVPADILPGIYSFSVAVPNTSTFHGAGFGDVLFSNSQYIEIIPPSTARYQVSSEELWCRKETAPQSWGSDEVGIKIITIPFFEDLKLGDLQETKVRFGDVDNSETRAMQNVLFTQTQPIAGLIMSVIGFEIDGEDAYKNQITDWTDVFVDLLREQWQIIIGGGAIAREIFTRLTNLGFWGYVIIAVAISLTLAIDLFVALWAPADLIIQDTLGFSATDLARLTNINIPGPVANSDTTIYTTPGDIEVRLMRAEKTPFQYLEQRGYISDEEDSWYNIMFRYNRLA
jgi:hypothetical protein